MSATLEHIKQYLEEEGYKYTEQNDAYVIAAKGKWQLYVFIRLTEGGEFLNINTQLDDPSGNFLKAPIDAEDKGYEYLEKLRAYMLDQNYKFKIGHWGVDKDDGDIRFSANCHIEDAVLTKKQFIRSIKSALQSADDGAADIDNILKTGVVVSTLKIPETKKLARAAKELLSQGKTSEAMAILVKLSV